MKRIKFLHVSDIHLDAPFTSLGAGDGKASLRRQDLLETFQAAIDAAQREEVDIILISGDLYEHNYVRKSTIHFINDKFNKIQGIKVFIVPGNHDPYVPNSYYRYFHWSKNVFILGEENPCVRLEELQTCIYGIGFNEFMKDGANLKGLGNISRQYINILLTHGTVDMDIGRSSYNPMKSFELAGLGMDYIALGHFHNKLENAGGIGSIYNPGSPEPLGFDEPGNHGVFIGTLILEDSGDKSLEVNFVKLNKRSYRTLTLNVGGCSNDYQVLEKVRDTLLVDQPGHDLYEIILKGYVEQGVKIDIGFLQQSLRNELFYLKIRNEAMEDCDFDSIAEEPGIRGLFVRKMLERIRKCKDENERTLLTQSLYYGIEALEKGKVEIV